MGPSLSFARRLAGCAGFFLMTGMAWCQPPVQQTAITGRVVRKSDRRPVPHVEVRVAPRAEASRSQTVLTVEDGTFEFPRVPEGQYDLIVQVPFEQDKLAARPVAAVGRELAVGDVEVSGVQWVSVTLVGADGAPAAERELRVGYADAIRRAYGTWRGRTTAQGRFEKLVLPGDYRVWLTVPGLGCAGNREFAVEANKDLDLGTLAVEPTGTVTGKAVWQSGGEPVADMQVYLRGVEPPVSDLHLPGVRTGPDGRFSFADVPKGRYRLSGYDDRHRYAREQTVTVGEEPVETEVRLPRGADLQGQILSPTGQPVANATAKLGGNVWYEEGHGSGLRADLTTDAAGRFEHKGLLAGRATLTVLVLGVGYATADKFELRDGETSEITLKLQAGCALEGTVQDSQGQPLGGARASVAFYFGRQHYPEVRIDTDHAGRFSLAGLPPGKAMVAARHPGYAVLQPPIPELTTEAPTTVTVTMARTGPLRGRLTQAGKPLAGATLELDGFTRTVTDRDGLFEYKDQRPGKHRLKITRGHGVLLKTTVDVPEGGMNDPVEVRVEDAETTEGPVPPPPLR